MVESDPPSPTSYYAMSDDEENDYETIGHSKADKGVKLLFAKSKVYIHPTKASKDNIAGYVALVQQKAGPSAGAETRTSAERSRSEERPSTAESSNLLLAWIPETALGSAHDSYVKVDLSDTSSPPKISYLVPAPPINTSAALSAVGPYAFSVPVSNVYSLLVQPPNLGWWYGSLVINTRAGDSFPALFFHDDECQSTILQRRRLAKESFDPFEHGGHGGMFWGGDEVLRWIKRYVRVERAGAEPNIFLVEPTPEDKKGFSTLNVPKKDAGDSHSRTSSVASTAGKNKDGEMDPITKMLKEARWNILEKLSQVTTFTRRTAQAVAENPRVPPQIRSLMRNPEVQNLQEEYDSARIYLARWAMQIADQSDRERDRRVWNATDVLDLESTDVGEFEILDMGSGKGSSGLQDRRGPVTMDEWESFFDPHSGRLQITIDEVKNKVFHGGLDPEDGVRKEAWLYLLGVYQWDSSKEERLASMNSMRDEYIRLKGKWWERMIDGSRTEEETEWWREQKNRIEKDVHRTDRNIPLFAGEDIPHPDPDSPFADIGTNVHLEQLKDMLLTYNEYNKDLGYVQGMSDLLAPIYAVIQDDAVAFWSFAKFMERMERNFLRDQSGMRLQLQTLDHLVQLLDPQLYKHLQRADSTNFFFFFRMLLVWYKREFAWMDVLRLWEVLWTDYYTSNFHLFIAFAILEKHRGVIMEHLKHFDEVLKYINELSNTIDLDTTLVKAEALFKKFQRTVEAIDRKSTFPAPSVPQSLSSTARPAPIANEATPTSPKPVVPEPDSASSTTGRPAQESPSSTSRREGGALDKGKGPASPRLNTRVGPRGRARPPPEELKSPVTDVVSPELRNLLRRDAPWMDRKTLPGPKTTK